MNFWIHLRDALMGLLEIGQNLFDAALLHAERQKLLNDLGTLAYINQTEPSTRYASDIISEVRILETKIKDLENELDEVFEKTVETDPLDWI